MVFQPDKKSKYSMRMVVQKIFCVVIAAALAISLTACQQNAEGTESAVNTASQSTANTTYTGTVTEISAESIGYLGELCRRESECLNAVVHHDKTKTTRANPKRTG